MQIEGVPLLRARLLLMWETCFGTARPFLSLYSRTSYGRQRLSASTKNMKSCWNLTGFYILRFAVLHNGIHLRICPQLGICRADRKTESRRRVILWASDSIPPWGWLTLFSNGLVITPHHWRVDRSSKHPPTAGANGQLSMLPKKNANNGYKKV